MNLPYHSKRIHSPTNDYDAITNRQTTVTTTRMTRTTSVTTPERPPARKKVIPDDMFTNQMAAMSLAHDFPVADNEKFNSNNGNNNLRLERLTQDLVTRIDDIDAFLADDKDSDTDVNRDTYTGTTNELVDVYLGDLTLPFEQVPGTTRLRIPDFVLHANDIPTQGNAAAQTAYEMLQREQHSLQQHLSTTTTSIPTVSDTSLTSTPTEHQELDTQYEAMDLD